MPGSKAAPSRTKANAEGDRKVKGRPHRPAGKSGLSPRRPLPPPGPPGAGRGAEEPSSAVGPPNRRRPGALAPAPPRTARTPGRRPLMVWPVGSRHPFGSASCSSCSGSSAGARSCGGRGQWAGGGEHRTISAGCSARGGRGGKPRSAGTAQGPSSGRRRDPGAGLSSPRVSTCCPNPPRPPFPVPTPARCGRRPDGHCPGITDRRGSSGTGSCYCWC